MAFASDAQRRYFFANAGFSEGAIDAAVSRNASDRERAVREHMANGGFPESATDRAVERAAKSGFGVSDREERTTTYDDKGNWNASQWTAYSYGLGADGKKEREEDNWTGAQWAAFVQGRSEK